MVIVSVIYLLAIYLIFHKFKLLPWNTVSKLIALIIGVIILSGFLVGLQGLTPSSTQAVIRAISLLTVFHGSSLNLWKTR